MRILLLGACLLILFTQSVFACESCAIVDIGKKMDLERSNKHAITAKIVYEQQDWKEADAMVLHEMHHDGFHVHNKQNEEIIHAALSWALNKRLNIDVDIPSITRRYIEVDSHPHTGENQTSQGLGDIMFTGDYRFILDEKKSVGVIAGVKVPSGKTDEHNSFGGLIEPELQPGSGSLDYVAGLSASLHPQGADITATAIYIYRTQGKQDFRFGDLLSVTFYAGQTFNVNDRLSWKAGFVINNQLEKKHNDDNGFIKDSGGFTMLVGPQLSLQFDPLEVGFSYFAPTLQRLGGVHQELDTGMWTTNVGVRF